MRISSRHTFTEAEDKLVLAASRDELSLVAERVSTTSVTVRRRYLKKKISRKAPPNPSYHYQSYRNAPSEPRRVADRFARPSWFDEDLTALTKGAV